MKYYDWNEILTNYFFNPTKSGEEVYLFITKNEIIKLGKDRLIGLSDELIWKDYMNSLRKGAPTSRKKYLIEQTISEYNNSNGNIEEIPLYISYLVSLILPVIESTEEFNSNNYYDKLDEFLTLNKFIGDKICSLKDIDDAWNNLEKWSKTIKNGELGIFEVKEYKNNYKYAAKPISQCLIPPKIIKKLPELFFKSGLIPNVNYPDDSFQELLLKYKIGLTENSIKTIKDKNDLGSTIIDIVKREYHKWDGESNELTIDGDNQIIKRNYFTCRLYSQFKINENDGVIKFSYRIKANNEFPDDLVFEGKQISYEYKEWSNTIQLEFQESLELRDQHNKWIAKFHKTKNDIYIFCNRNNIQLGSEYWIETDKLSNYNWNYILCNIRQKDKLIEWGNHFNRNEFFIEDVEGLPIGYILFKIYRPKCSLNGIPELTVFTHKSIDVKGGLRIDGRKYMNIYLPEVEVINSDGNESVYISYDGTLEKVFLKKKFGKGNTWLLPKNILLDKKFTINIQDEIIQTANYKYEILNNKYSYSKLDKNCLIKRNKYGELIGDEESKFIKGVIPEPYNYTQQEPYFHLIKPNNSSSVKINVERKQYKYHNDFGNILISFITFKKICSTEEFYNAYKYIYDKSFEDSKIEFRNSIPKQKLLHYFDNLEFIDYNYESKKISVINPQFINLPTNLGRKVLLIGGRDESLIEKLIDSCNELKLSIEIIERNKYFKFLPDVISIKSYDTETNQFGEKEINELATKLNIEYHENKFIPFGVQDFSSSISEYKEYILQNRVIDSTDNSWVRRIFNSDNFEFEKNDNDNFIRDYTLLEYKLSEYEIKYKIWIDKKWYIVDRNWGRYLVLNHNQLNVILHDKSNDWIAIPVLLQLPRLLSKALYLLSGQLPSFKKINFNGNLINYLIFENVPNTLAANLFKFKLNQEIQEYNLIQ